MAESDESHSDSRMKIQNKAALYSHLLGEVKYPNDASSLVLMWHIMKEKQKGIGLICLCTKHGLSMK